jgi:hypothetical protein
MDETTGFWTVALGAATAAGTWDGFRICPSRRGIAELHVDGLLTIKDDHPKSRDYALVLSHPSKGVERVLVAGKYGTIEFGHDLVELLALETLEAVDGALPSLWLTDLSTGACSERCELPRPPRAGTSAAPDPFSLPAVSATGPSGGEPR